METLTGPHEYHIEAAVFDTGSATRVSDATVTANVSGLGLLGHEEKLEPMNIVDTTTYGAFFSDTYQVSISIRSG